MKTIVGVDFDNTGQLQFSILAITVHLSVLETTSVAVEYGGDQCLFSSMSFPSLIYHDFSNNITLDREMKTLFMTVGNHVDKTARGLSFDHHWE